MGGIEARIQEIIGDPAQFVIYALIVVIAIALHEFGHAFMAVACGDPTPRADGRVTLNPLAHLDPLGTIGIFLFGFGWGKPVMVQPRNFRRKWDDVKVSAAGPAMNLFQAILFAIGMRTILQLGIDAPVGYGILRIGVRVNIMLMVFNMIPVGPLDGATVLRGFMPPRMGYEFHAFNQRWGMLLMIALIFTGVLGTVIQPVLAVFMSYVHWGLA